jgi:hypothetical protein
MSLTDEFINKLIISTEKNSLTWKSFLHIKQNRMLKKYLSINEKIKNPPIFETKYNVNKRKSFYTKYQDGYIYIFVKSRSQAPSIKRKTDFYILSYQTNSLSEVVEINNSNEFQSQLFILYRLVKQSVKNVNNFIGNFLEDENIED